MVGDHVPRAGTPWLRFYLEDRAGLLQVDELIPQRALPRTIGERPPPECLPAPEGLREVEGFKSDPSGCSHLVVLAVWLSLVSYLAQEGLPVLDVPWAFHTLRSLAVHYPEDPAAHLVLCHDHLNGVRGRTEDRADLLQSLYRVQHVDRVTILQHEDEAMPSTNVRGI